MKKKIIVVLEQDHSETTPRTAIRIDTQGFVGSSCLNEIEALAKILEGAGVILHVDKREMKTAQQIAAETGTPLELVIREHQDEDEWYTEEGC